VVIRLAIVDSDSGFVRVLTKRLEAVGWEHRVFPGAPPADDLVAMRLSALVVDPAVLGPHAWQFLEHVCAQLPGLGVVVCTGRSTVAQRVRGLRLGADDWVTKPCHPEEVVARVEAVVRRRKRATARTDSGPLVAGELEIRVDQYQAFVGTQSADLTRREFELLHLLVEGGGQVLQREEIYQRVWGYEMARGDRSVDVFVRKLRSKLNRLSPEWTYIHTHFGIGYRFQPEPSDDDPDPAAPVPLDQGARASATESGGGEAPSSPAAEWSADRAPASGSGVRSSA
jgi:DNA-binding response OmpR family regulator